jgi:cytochrome d ubiquinol oxidase subunit II
MLGLPFRFDDTLRMTWSGGFFDLLTPFPLLCGLTSIAMLTMHGGTFLALKSDGTVAARATRFAAWAAVALVLLFTVCGLWVGFGIDGQVLAAGTPHDALSNPLTKAVSLRPGAWLGNYATHPWFVLAPILGYAGAGAAILALRGRRPGLGFIASALAVGGVVATFGLSLFPFLLPSALDPKSGLTIWDASSSQLTLFIMLVGTAIFLPLVLLYTAFVFHALRGKVTAAQIEADSHGNY